MDDRRFDDLAKRMTESRASRRLVATGVFGAAAGVLSAVGNPLDTLAGRRKRRRKGNGKGKKHKPLRCSGDSCDGTGGKRCGGRDDCQCYRAAKGGNVCASSLQSSCDAICDNNKDCPKGHVCVEGGPACCGNGVKFCKKACYK
ncbi:MAG: hypothetical protein ACRDJC_26635 [Thermomicrobiales bacterium]